MTQSRQISKTQRSANARGVHGQEDVSTEQRPAQEDAWIPRADENRKGSPGAQAPAGQGPEEIDGLGEAQGEKFAREDRLHHRREFEAVYSRGVRIPGPHFVLFILPNNAGRCRLGVTLSRKVGNAVVRNQARRRMREIFRKRRGFLQVSVDIVVNAKPQIARQPLALLEAEFLGCVARFAEVSKGRK